MPATIVRLRLVQGYEGRSIVTALFEIELISKAQGQGPLPQRKNTLSDLVPSFKSCETARDAPWLLKFPVNLLNARSHDAISTEPRSTERRVKVRKRMHLTDLRGCVREDREKVNEYTQKEFHRMTQRGSKGIANVGSECSQ
jgi:hypothetical protein